MAIARKQMTADELWQLPNDGQRHRLIAGELHTLAPAGHVHGRIAMRLAIPLGRYVAEHDLGDVYAAETGFLLARDPDTVQAPDVAFVRRERVAAVGEGEGPWFPGAPDLAVEVVSPNDRYTEVEETISRWLAAGCRMVLVIDPRRRTVAVHRSPAQVRPLDEAGVIEGEDVVPGWALPVAALFTTSHESTNA
jgi:Uma2 family endonuclease